MRARRALWIAVGGVLIACASIPPPRIFGELEAARSSPAVAEAEGLAPTVFARARQLERRAQAAHEDGQVGGAQVLAEHALAAYEHAVVLSRLSKAESRLAKAKLELDKVEGELARVDEKQKRVAAEAEGVEMEVRVAQDAVPLVPSTPASAEREQARMEAARALASQARLLCAATRLLGEAPRLDAAEKSVDALDKELATNPKVAPIDAAISSRSQCLQQLTEVRRKHKASGGGENADALLSALSSTKAFYPFRDDRGVVVTLRNILGKDGKPTKEAEAWLAALANVAKAHPSFPLLLVSHGGKSAATAAKTLSETLSALGAPKVALEHASNRQPVVDPRRGDANAQNTRFEFVFVAPRWQ
ncbi:MAG: hypothetical protein R3B13_28455 [Polyangiaceae bacterium]